jgi:hypothetical protein
MLKDGESRWVRKDTTMLQRTEKIAGSCSSGPCPAIHETNKPDTMAVQGYVPAPEELAAMGLPAGETVVVVPRGLLDQYAGR